MSTPTRRSNDIVASRYTVKHWYREDTPWFKDGRIWAALLSMVVIVLLDYIIADAILLSFLWVPVIIISNFYGPKITSAFVGLSLGLELLSGYINEYFTLNSETTRDELIRLAILVVVGGTAIVLSASLQSARRRQREVEEELVESEEQFRMTLRNAPIGMAVLSPEGHFMEANQALCSMLGRDEKEMLSLTWRDVTFPEDVEKSEEVINRILAGQAFSVGSRKRYVHSDGTVIWGDMSVSSVHLHDGKVKYLIKQVSDLTAQVAFEEKLKYQAQHDDLTGFLSRNEMLNRITAIATRTRRAGDEVAILFCDVDDFKHINDVYGHVAGDIVLKTISERIRSTIRSRDFCGRFGGDEMVLVLNGVGSVDSATGIAEKIRNEITNPILIAQGSINVTMSIGVTLLKSGEDIDALIARADEGMYQAKQIGKDYIISV